MDDKERFNESEMTVWVAGGKTPPQRNVSKEKVELIMNMVEPKRNVNVPDPYWGEFGFKKVYNMLDEATDAVLERYKN